MRFGNAAEKVAGWVKAQLPSRWPGITVRKQDGEPQFIRGQVHTVNRNAVWIETERHTIEPLMGAARPLFCEFCSRTIPACSALQMGPVSGLRQGIRGIQEPELPFCPYCPGERLRELRKGERVRLRYRFSPDGSSAQWFGELWEA